MVRRTDQIIAGASLTAPHPLQLVLQQSDSVRRSKFRLLSASAARALEVSLVGSSTAAAWNLQAPERFGNKQDAQPGRCGTSAGCEMLMEALLPGQELRTGARAGGDEPPSCVENKRQIPFLTATPQAFALSLSRWVQHRRPAVCSPGQLHTHTKLLNFQGKSGFNRKKDHTRCIYRWPYLRIGVLSHSQSHRLLAMLP